MLQQTVAFCEDTMMPSACDLPSVCWYHLRCVPVFQCLIQQRCLTMPERRQYEGACLKLPGNRYNCVLVLVHDGDEHLATRWQLLASCKCCLGICLWVQCVDAHDLAG